MLQGLHCDSEETSLWLGLMCALVDGIERALPVFACDGDENWEVPSLSSARAWSLYDEKAVPRAMSSKIQRSSASLSASKVGDTLQFLDSMLECADDKALGL